MSDATNTIPQGHLALLRRVGVDAVQHDSHIPFLTHLAGVRQLLVEWGAEPSLGDAGLFHSIYGTEFFDPHLERGPNREDVREIIGEHAERLAWLWCHTRRSSIARNLGREDAAVLEHRDGSAVSLDARELRDLVELWCADAVEQIDRLSPEVSDFSRGLPDVLPLASARARAAVRAIPRDLRPDSAT